MYEIIYNGEVIDCTNTTYEACELVKEYRMEFKSNNVYYITVGGVCKHVTNDLSDVNKWIKTNNKHIKNIYCKNKQETIIEVQ